MISPTVMALSATLKAGQRALPIYMSIKSTTTPKRNRYRSMRLPTAPPKIRHRAAESQRNFRDTRW